MENNNHGHLETSKADKAVWLMKCPTLVSRSFKTQEEPSRPVAKVILSIDPLLSNDDNELPQFTMELLGPDCGNAPKSYSMDISKDFIPMSVFSESPQGKLAVEGKILNKFDMRPHDENIENYGKLCRERTNKYMTKSRQTQFINNDTGSHMRPMPGMMITSVISDRRRQPAKASEMKRTRRDRGEMEEIMFKLFERQSNWTLRQLVQETDQPEVCFFIHLPAYCMDALFFLSFVLSLSHFILISQR
ncbi:hypothetical protein SLEP1_g5574 [Rubroshorea leprosula]|uniref:TFIIF beta subunit HTH domain-containing protein n=1 Tax=Rubroshorea leprosula TaxID=152421 RepID=A0AAV5HSF0_9ROSI|nr:hypothetical protein SLEP1_g5574 [Rubroshorea leprosula]